MEKDQNKTLTKLHAINNELDTLDRIVTGKADISKAVKLRTYATELAENDDKDARTVGVKLIDALNELTALQDAQSQSKIKHHAKRLQKRLNAANRAFNRYIEQVIQNGV